MSARRQSTAERRDTPGRISAEEIVDCALEVADSEGLSALTIRRVADDLGVGAMTLYTYFPNKEKILDGLADRVLGHLAVPSADKVNPIQVVRALAHAFFDLFRDHPSILALFSTRTTHSFDALRGGMEAPLKLLEDSGFTGQSAVQIYGVVVSYALGFAAYQAPRPWGHPHRADAAELRRQREHTYAAMPSAEFPTVTNLARPLTMLPSDEQFDFGLECILAGLSNNQ
jgi:AcrR family transcriptional regulator